MKTPAFRVSLLLVLATAASEAGTIVNFDGTSGISGTSLADINYVAIGGNNVNFGGSPTLTDRQALRPYVAATPLLTNSAEYTGPNVYGAYEGISFDVTGGNASNVQLLREYSTTNSVLRKTYTSTVAAVGGGSAPTEFSAAAFYYFQATTTGTSFDAASSLNITLGTAHNDLTLRHLVNDGGTFYLSATTYTPLAGGATDYTTLSLSGLALLSEQWAVFTPPTTGGSGNILNFDQATAVFAPHTFTDIRGGGVYFENDLYTKAANTNPALEISKLSIVSVPEPGTSAALLGSVFAFALRRRR